jgi:hypothetical protein
MISNDFFFDDRLINLVLIWHVQGAECLIDVKIHVAEVLEVAEYLLLYL